MLSKNTRKGGKCRQVSYSNSPCREATSFLLTQYIFLKTNKQKLSGTATVFKITEVPTAPSYHYNSLNPFVGLESDFCLNQGHRIRHNSVHLQPSLLTLAFINAVLSKLQTSLGYTQGIVQHLCPDTLDCGLYETGLTLRTHFLTSRVNVMYILPITHPFS